MALIAESNAAHREPSLAGNLLLVYGVTALDVALSLLVNVLIPMTASKADFANYRKLLLYVNYAGFSHLGLLSGMYLWVLGKSEEEIDWSLLTAVKGTLVATQIAVLSSVLIMVWMFASHGPARLIIALSVVCWGAINVTTFYNYLFQGTNKFRVFFLVNLSVRVLSILMVCYVVATGVATSVGLALIVVVPIFMSVAVYECVWRVIVKDKRTGVLGSRRDGVLHLWRRGVVLYGANVCLSLLFTLDKLTVSVFFGPSEFANYAFAYGLVTVLYFATDGLTAVATPHLARVMRSADMQDASHRVYSIVVWLVPAAYWLSAALVRRVFPQYIESIPLLMLFAASLPLNVLVRSRVVAIATATGTERRLLTFVVASLTVTFICIVAAYVLLHSVYGVALAWTIAMIVIGVGRVFVADHTAGGVDKSERQLVANAVGATLLFTACAAGGSGLQFGTLYVVGAALASAIQLARA